MHPLYGALPVLYVPVRIMRTALFAHRYTYAPRPAERMTFIPLTVFLWNDLATLYSMVWDWMVLRGGPMLFINLIN